MITLAAITLSLIFYFKNNYYWSIIIIFFMITEGYQLIPNNILTYGFFTGDSIDGAILEFIVILILRLKVWTKSIIVKQKFYKYILIFVTLLFVNLIYSVFVLEYSPLDSIKSLRVYLLLFAVFLFYEVPLMTLKKIIQVLIVITFCQSVLYICQIVTGSIILNGEQTDLLLEEDYIRYYNLPKLIDFSIFICLYSFPIKGYKVLKPLFLLIFFIAIIGSFHRSLILSWGLSLLICLIVFNSFHKKMIYGFLFSIVTLFLLSIDLVRLRVYNAFVEINSLNSLSDYSLTASNSTFAYRISHFLERFYYITSIPFGWLFGIGLLEEKSPQTRLLPFKIGLFDKTSGKIIKIYSADLVWSTLLLTTGIVGCILIIIFYSSLLNFFNKNKKINSSKAGFGLVLVGFLTSLTSNQLMLPTYFLPILILVALSIKLKQSLFYKRNALSEIDII